VARYEVSKMNECCDYYRIGVDEINRYLFFEQGRNPANKFKGKPFNYCPWCGQNREDIIYDSAEKLKADLDSPL